MTDQRSSSAVADVLQDAVLSHAAALARSDEQDAATMLLENWLTTGPVTAEALDLLARVYAQQGRLDDAECRWRQAVAIAPAHKEYAEALRQIQRIRSRPRWLRRPVPVLGGLGLAAGLLLLLGSDALRTAGSAGRPVGVADTIAVLSPAPARTADLRCTGRPVLAPVAGIRQDTLDATTLALVPEGGLFEQGTALDADSRALLRRVGLAMLPLADDITVRLTGYTDDRLPSPAALASGFDNNDLGLRRAVAVARVLRLASGLPIGRFEVRSSGADRPPFENAALGGRPRNRTVVIELLANPAAVCEAHS